MNILIVSPFFPYPLTQGGKITIFNTLKYLSRGHSVSFACLAEAPVSDYGPLQDFCTEIIVVERKPQLLRDLAVFLAGSAPFNAVLFHSPEFARQLRQLLQRKTFDIVQIEFTLMWQYAHIFADIPCVLDAHNIEQRIIQQNRMNCRNPLKKFLYGLEEKKLRLLEEKAWRECRLCFTVSNLEREVIASYLGSDAKLITMVGVDLARFEFFVKPETGKRILFVGGLNYHPNRDSAVYFINEIIPAIRSRLPDVKVDIVGHELWRVADLLAPHDNIELHESVPEILPWFRKADLLVVPLRLGGGIRIKILEAMAAGLPVVATPKGCEGLEVEYGSQLLVAETADAFADQVVRLLQNRELRGMLAVNARRFVAERFSWESLVERMVGGYQRLM